MPIISAQQAFMALGIPPEQAAAMAEEHRAANGGLEHFGYVPGVPQHNPDDGDRYLDLAEKERKKGNFNEAERILLECIQDCKSDSQYIVEELRAYVKLAHVYREKEDFAKANEQFQVAHDTYEDWMTEEERELHPISYLTLWAECCEKLALNKKAQELRAEAKEVAVRYESFWDDEDSDEDNSEE
ncbi:hypothetical protein AAF712_008404 [Marasmius tenuissimus]|uniref:Tetratricopeptide repeat protein n=1 Tax=Marasmius tenuissimus TaxID=585030 RepID=A0ABR2ZT23_9AGAR